MARSKKGEQGIPFYVGSFGLPLRLPFYEQKHGSLSGAVRKKLLRISPATTDRLLKKTRARHPPRLFASTGGL